MNRWIRIPDHGQMAPRRRMIVAIDHQDWVDFVSADLPELQAYAEHASLDHAALVLLQPMNAVTEAMLRRLIVWMSERNKWGWTNEPFVLTGAQYSLNRQALELFAESQRFDAVPPGAEAPVMVKGCAFPGYDISEAD